METMTTHTPLMASVEVATSPSKFIPSPEQQALFDAFLNTNDNLAIAAGAGTGKTTTLVELAKRLPKSGHKLFCAFNRDIVKELKERLNGTGMWAKTFHGIGYGPLKKKLKVQTLEPDESKYPRLIAEFMTSQHPQAEKLRAAIEASMR